MMMVPLARFSHLISSIGEESEIVIYCDINMANHTVSLTHTHTHTHTHTPHWSEDLRILQAAKPTKS